MKIVSPMPSGSGAILVHRALEQAIDGYHVKPYNPWFTLFPPLLYGINCGSANLIHTTPDYAPFFARRGRPLVITFHNFVIDSFMQRYSSLLQRIHYQTDLRLFTGMAVARADMVTAVSQFTADLVTQYFRPSKPIHVIPNGIDTSRFYPTTSKGHAGTVRVLFSGNLSIRKGAPLLPHIAGMLSSNVKIIVAGRRRHLRGLEGIDNIELIGEVPYLKMPELYRNVDILLMPTVREGMSLAVLEAMASGLPIVATDCSSMPELIAHGKGGFLCELGNAEEFAKYINQLAEDSNLRQEMGEYNRSKVESGYQLNAMVDHYRELFSQLLEN